MKRNTMFATVLGGIAALSLVPVMSESANASSLTSSWNYQYDAVGDGSGGKAYDIKGMAMSIQGDKLVVALMGGTKLSGEMYNKTNISWGDMFFNFSGKSFKEAEAAGQLYGVRFAQSNDTKVDLGVYSGVKTTSVTGSNYGYSSLESYYKAGFDKANTQGTALSTKQAAYDYYGKGSIQNSIASGNKVGGVDILAMNDLLGLGLNFTGKTTSDSIFGFSVDKNSLGSGNFLANIFLECGNDAMAFSASAAPEPTTMAGTALGIAAFGALKRRRRQKQTAEKAD